MRVKKRIGLLAGTAVFFLLAGLLNGETAQAAEKRVVKVALGDTHSAAITEDGSLWMWGHGTDGEMGNNNSSNISNPVEIMKGVSQLSLGTWESAVIKNDGSLWMSGNNTFISFREKTWKKIAAGVKLVELGSTHAAMIKNDKSFYTWGGGWKGQLGDGSGKNIKSPVRIRIGETNPGTTGSGSKPYIGGIPGQNNGSKLPKKNSTFKYQNMTYKVTKSDAKKGTAALVKGDSKKTAASVPAVVKKNGYTFKVTQISGKAFYKYTKLKKITLGKNITSIGAKAFMGCTSLQAVSLDQGLITIGDAAFGGCKRLKKLVVPAKVKTIGKEAFAKCSSLKTIQIKSTVLKKVGKKAFSGIHKKAVIKVPSKKLKAYQKLLKKKGQASTVKIKR